MNDKEFNKVDWINIIIHKCFQDYFNIDELKDLSMLSKLTRAKLNPVLFKSICLLNQTIDLDCYYEKFFNSEAFDELNRIVYTDMDEIQNDLRIQKYLSDINLELQDIKHLVNRIFIQEVSESGDYLYPILNNFINLSVLKIHHSTIQYCLFQKLGEYFPMLKTFELHYVVLSKEFTDNNNSKDIIFPFDLSCLNICCIEVTDLSISSGHCRDVIDINEYDLRSKFVLPNISLPSLKELEFILCSIKDNGLEEFLETNPNLEQLGIDTISPGMSKYFNSLKSLHVYDLEKINNLENLITHKNIKTLKISIEDNRYYDKFKKLCSICPSVEHLYFNIWDTDSYQSAIDTYLVPISKKLTNLKTIELPINYLNGDSININQFPKIEKIIFEIQNGLHLDVYFENHCNLKEIEFRDTYRDIDKEEFLGKLKNYNGWRFKFYKRKVKGFEIKS